MLYSINSVKRDVRIVIDQNRTSTALAGIGDVDTLALDEIIQSAILDAVRRVHLQAPVHHLSDVAESFSSASSTNNSLERPSHFDFILPDDFLRLVAVRLNPWRRTLVSAITPEHPRYQSLCSRVSGVTATSEFPEAVFMPTENGLTLQCYPAGRGVIVTALYVAQPKITSLGTNVPDADNELKPGTNVPDADNELKPGIGSGLTLDDVEENTNNSHEETSGTSDDDLTPMLPSNPLDSAEEKDSGITIIPGSEQESIDPIIPDATPASREKFISIARLCYQHVVYTAAAIALTTVGEHALAAQLMSLTDS